MFTLRALQVWHPPDFLFEAEEVGAGSEATAVLVLAVRDGSISLSIQSNQSAECRVATPVGCRRQQRRSIQSNDARCYQENRVATALGSLS